MDNEEENELRGIREMVRERARLQREDWSTGYVIRDVTDVESLLLHLERQLAEQAEIVWHLKRERSGLENEIELSWAALDRETENVTLECHRFAAVVLRRLLRYPPLEVRDVELAAEEMEAIARGFEPEPSADGPKTLTLDQVEAGAERASDRVDNWPAWKREISEHAEWWPCVRCGAIGAPYGVCCGR